MIFGLALARWRGAAHEHRSIAKGMVLVGLFAFAGKLAGAAKEMAVAWRYGVSAEVDAYLFVFNLVNWPVSVWFSVLSVILIPLAARIRAERPEALGRFRAELLAVTIGAGVLLAIGGLVLLPRLLQSSWVGLPPQTVLLARQVIPGMVWFTLAGLLVSLYSSWIMSEGGHANTLLEGMPALGILVAVLLTGGIESLVWGLLAGALVQVAGSVAAQGGAGERSLPHFSLSSPYWAPFRQGFGVMMLGQVVISLTTIIDQFFAARLDEGSISALGYSGRILALLTTMFATAVTRATLPVFSRSRAEGGTMLRPVALRWTWMMGLVGVVVAAAAWALAPWGVHLLFERGTFTAADTATVAHVLRFSVLQVPFYCASLVLVSLHSSDGRYRLLLMSGILGLTVKTAASFLLLPILGVAGLMLSYTAMYGANLLLFLQATPAIRYPEPKRA